MLVLGSKGAYQLLTLLALRFHHADAQGEEDRDGDRSCGDGTTVPCEAEEGSELLVTPPHVDCAHQSGGEDHEDHGLERPAPDKAEGTERGSRPHTEPNAQDERLLLLLQSVEMR